MWNPWQMAVLLLWASHHRESRCCCSSLRDLLRLRFLHRRALLRTCRCPADCVSGFRCRACFASRSPLPRCPPLSPTPSSPPASPSSTPRSKRLSPTKPVFVHHHFGLFGFFLLLLHHHHHHQFILLHHQQIT